MNFSTEIRTDHILGLAQIRKTANWAGVVAPILEGLNWTAGTEPLKGEAARGEAKVLGAFAGQASVLLQGLANCDRYLEEQSDSEACSIAVTAMGVLNQALRVAREHLVAQIMGLELGIATTDSTHRNLVEVQLKIERLCIDSPAAVAAFADLAPMVMVDRELAAA